SVLHDHPLLSSAEISAALPNNDLAQQFERVKITPLALGVEEISKLWMVFQTQYRISAAYEVTVILIDSRTPTNAPLPVLKRSSAVTLGAGLLHPRTRGDEDWRAADRQQRNSIRVGAAHHCGVSQHRAGCSGCDDHLRAALGRRSARVVAVRQSTSGADVDHD